MAKIYDLRRDLRRQIEAALEKKIPSALTPVPKIRSAVHPTGIEALDELLHGGLPQGALTETCRSRMLGPNLDCSFISGEDDAEARVCAWIDVSNALDPASAAAVGVDLRRLLWLRCGVLQPLRHRNYKFELCRRSIL